jgi:predicted DNA-binding transcriptional regulator YafY
MPENTISMLTVKVSGKAEEVLLKFTPEQGKYIKSVPMHKTQQIVEEDQTGTTVKLHVMITYELVQDIVSYAYKVRVLSPWSLAEKVYRIHQKAMKQYE